MAKHPIEVLKKDVRQGRTFWLVEVVIVDGMPGEKRAERMARYPHQPGYWANDDAWGRARIKQPRRIFIHDRAFHLEALSILFETSKLFYREKDAQVYYDLIAPFARKKKAELEARFPPSINMPRLWDHLGNRTLTLAEVPLNSLLPNGLKDNP